MSLLLRHPLLTGLSAVLLLALISLWVTNARLKVTQGELEALKHQIAIAHADSALRGATTGQEAVIHVLETQKADAPVVERVVTRLRDVCLREPPDHLPVPEGAEPAAGASAGAGDDEDRAFADAAARDLGTCQAELTKLSALQDWCKSNGC